MTVIKVRKSVLRGVAVLFFLALPLALSLVLSACNAPMGLGDPIDWEPPVLTLDGPTVRYVREGTTITGTVKDNVKVDRVILRDTKTGVQLFTAKLLPNDRWEIDLVFDESRNGDKILGELVGYDSFGNSGDTSIKGITLNIDLRPPFVDDIWISRTEIRRAYLEKIMDLQAMEESDPRGDWPLFVDMYQNGSFWIDAKISELETRIENLFLHIYDESYPDTPIFSQGIERIITTTTFNPRFLINEEDILAAGNALWPGYRAAYDGGKRNYYRVEIEAVDNAQNRNFPLIDQMDYFCMWKTADMPKGRLDPIVGITDPITIPKGSTLPIQFFDDDVLDFAYAALFTKDQWEGIGYIAPDVRIPNGTTEEKRDWLTDRLLRNLDPVYNWRYDKWFGELIDPTSSPGKSNKVENIILQGGVDDLLHFVQAGNAETDFGDYVLFSLVGDRKLLPHNTPGNSSTAAENLRRSFSWNVNVIDENAPLIIFDTENGCPEENTFPQDLRAGRFFDIIGYTLRENSSGMNSVIRFRMAWIPFGLPGGADSYITAVREALRRQNPEGSVPQGVQWWNFDEDIVNPDNISYASIGGDNNYIEQHFKKTFDVQGGPDRLPKEEETYHASYKNFTYIDPETGEEVFENTTKLFIFYVIDNMGHEVFSQRYLLGNRIPPTLTVYDLTGRTNLSILQPPNIYTSVADDPNSGGAITDEVRKAYQQKLDEYNEMPNTYNTINNSATNLSDGDEAATLQAYPRGATISYWATAGKAAGGLEVTDIIMEDVTSSVSTEGRPNGIGHFNKPESTDDDIPWLSYTEYLPEVEQRTFRFTAIDALRNRNTIQRTVVISAAALLSEITTRTPSGTYGIDTEIILQARFSGTVKWRGSNKPLLNVHYKKGGVVQIYQIPTSTPSDTDVQSLEFPITVGLNDGDTIQTMYKGINLGEITGVTDRPLTLTGNTVILDADRDDYPAFIPGYSVGYEWLDNKGSLQITKTIALDGIPPRVDGNAIISGSPYETEGGTQYWYYKRDETIEFTLSPATKNIFTGGGGNPRIEFKVGDAGPFYADWQRSANNGRSMVFSAIVAEGWGTGTIQDVRPNTAQGTIIDSVGNKLLNSGDDFPVTTLTLNGTIRIDQTPPAIPAPVTVDSKYPNTSGTNNYNGNPVLSVSTTAPGNESWGIARTEYSLNNGLRWETYTTPPTAVDGWTSVSGGYLTINGGEWILRTRHVDKAGNEGVATTHILSVNSNFPRLGSISADKPNGRYKAGETINFTLSFAAPVWTETPSNVSIILTNRNATNSNIPGGVDPTYQQTLTAATTTPNSATTASTTVSFAWEDIAEKEMLDGLYVSAVDFTALSDIYGNTGSTGTAGITNPYQLTIIYNSGGTTTYSCDNLNGAGLIVDCLPPTFSSMTPENAQGRPGNNRANSVMSATNNVITLTFREPVQRGSGTITIKPHGEYFIPPVFENDTYYLNVSTGARSANPQSGYSRITGFYDIYNALPSGGTPNHRNNLTAGSSLVNLTTDARTGQSAGPYIKMTHGLKEGAGYSGDYDNTMNNTEYNNGTANGPNTVLYASTADPYMIPDTATKWVLDYRYSINNSTNTQVVPATANNPALADADPAVVTAIRAALSAAKFRWQEIDVSSSNVSISGSTVTITLPEALENGLQWDVCYPAEAFADLAGHNVPAMNWSGNSPVGETGATHWFISSGVQTPIIRVNRKSFDARTQNWSNPTTSNTGDATTYALPTDRNAPGGWGIGDFNTIYYRIETETPDASLNYGTINGRDDLGKNNHSIGSAYIVNATNAGTTPNATTWAGLAITASTGTYTYNTTTWDFSANVAATSGTLARPNLIRRNQNGTGSWSVIENGVTVTRSFQGNHRGFRSYNRDVRKSRLDSIAVNTTLTTPVSPGNTLSLPYYNTEARKDYVIAEARINHGTPATTFNARGYEGVFRTVIALLQAQDTNPLYVEGSNVKNGMPSIAGFPVQDAAESGDNRYIKYFYREGTGGGQTRFYWVSTEIVSEWYFIKFGNGSRHMTNGEVNNYLMVGYGDLTYAYHVTGS